MIASSARTKLTRGHRWAHATLKPEANTVELVTGPRCTDISVIVLAGISKSRYRDRTGQRTVKAPSGAVLQHTAAAHAFQPPTLQRFQALDGRTISAGDESHVNASITQSRSGGCPPGTHATTPS